MGCFASKESRPAPACGDSKAIALDTPFSVKEVEALYQLFMKISSLIVKDELINKDEFQLAMFRKPDEQNFFADRLFDLFDCNRDGAIDFEEFVRSLGVFHPNAQFESKAAFTFKLHDLRNSGFIERNEVKQMVFSLLHESDLELPEDVVELIVEKTFSQAAKGNPQINFEEWKELVSQNPSLIKNMNLPYLKEITLSFPSFSIKVEHQST